MKRDSILALIAAGTLTIEQLIKLCLIAETGFTTKTKKAVWTALIKSVKWADLEIERLENIYNSEPNWEVMLAIINTGKLSAETMLSKAKGFDGGFKMLNALIKTKKFSVAELVKILGYSEEVRLLDSALTVLDLKKLSNIQLLELLNTRKVEGVSAQKLKKCLKLTGKPNSTLIKLAEANATHASAKIIVEHLNFSKLSTDEIISLGEKLDNSDVWDVFFTELQKLKKKK